MERTRGIRAARQLIQALGGGSTVAEPPAMQWSCGAPVPNAYSIQESIDMTTFTYEIVEHDGGWAYTVDGVFSESFPTHAKALAAAKRAAAEQRVPGRTEAIEYETADGKWHTETASGSDRPETDIEDKR